MITAKRLREILDYDPETGIFTWEIQKSSRAMKGRVAGAPSRGYLVIGVDGRMYQAHRLAWLYMTGEWPTDEIDHIDLDKSNNRWANLRGASKAQNQANRGLQSNNTTGFKGVNWNAIRQAYVARISVGGRRIHLGYRDTPQEAASLYAEATKQFNGEFSRVE